MKDMTKLPYIVAIDFDGTLVDDEFPSIGAPKEKVVKGLKRLMMEYPTHKFILWTCRDNDTEERHLDKAVEFCKNTLGLYFDAVNENVAEVKEMFANDTRKVYANFYVDDKAGNEYILEAWADA